MINTILAKISTCQDLTNEEQETIFVLVLDNFINNYNKLEQYFGKFNIEHLLDGYISYERTIPSDFFIDSLSIFLNNPNLKQDTNLYSETIYFLVRFLNQKEYFKTSTKLCRSYLDQNPDVNQIDCLTFNYLTYFSNFNEDEHIKPPSDHIAMLKAEEFTQAVIKKARDSLTFNFVDDPLEPMFGEKGIKRNLLANLYYKNRNKIS